jgi:hypothetical protein
MTPPGIEKFTPPRGRNVSRFRGPKATAKQPVRTAFCIHLGPRIEFRAGCWKGCLHACEKGHEARPAKTCGICPDYAAEIPPSQPE